MPRVPGASSRPGECFPQLQMHVGAHGPQPSRKYRGGHLWRWPSAVSPGYTGQHVTFNSILKGEIKLRDEVEPKPAMQFADLCFEYT